MKEWKNTIKKYVARPAYFVKAKSVEELRDAVKLAEDKNIKIRAVGSGHSFSDIAIVPQGGVLVDISKIDFFQLYSKEKTKLAFKEKKLVETGGGITIKKLNRCLDRENLSIINMGGIDHQTIAGAFSTATHGTGINLPSMPGMIRSIVIVTSGSKIYRIEPENGITDPANHNESNTTLLQDDHIFNAVVVGLGCMGIIYSVVMEVENMYWLREVKRVYPWEEVKPLLANRSLHHGMRGVMVQVNPYTVDHRRSCVVVTHEYLSELPLRHRTYNEATRNLLPILGNNPLVYAFLIHRMNRKMEKMPKMLESSLKSVQDKVYLNRAHKVLYQGIEYVKERAFDSEFAFDLSTNSYLDAVEELFEKAAEIADKYRLYQSAPIGFRFVQKSTAYMAPEYNRDVCYIDTPFLLKAKGSEVILQEYQKIMFRHGGIPHWGKINSILDTNTEKIPELYPKFTDWQQVIFTFNSSGIFNNYFTKRLKLEKDLPVSDQIV
ncbi:MAG: FAD-binding protein [Bacteroidota bacterium]